MSDVGHFVLGIAHFADALNWTWQLKNSLVVALCWSTT